MGLDSKFKNKLNLLYKKIVQVHIQTLTKTFSSFESSSEAKPGQVTVLKNKIEILT